MTVSEAITKSGITPSASYTGIETANDFILAFQIEKIGRASCRERV